MKKKTVLAVLMFLYIGLIFLVPSSIAPARVDGPNISKDFSPSDTVNISPSSITSFSQTNPADGNDWWPDGYNNSLANNYDRYNMAGIGNWVSLGLEAGDTKGTSGDYGWLKVKVTGADDWDGMYTNRPSFTAASLANTYFEIRYKGNTTNQALWRMHGFTSADCSGTAFVITTLTKTTTWTTYRALMPSTNALESLSLEVESMTGSVPLEIDYDYLLLTPSNLSGWQNDCSATGNVTTQDCSASSDGDKITFTATSDYAWGGFWIDYPTSTTAALKAIDYPMLEICVTSIGVNPVLLQVESPDTHVIDMGPMNATGTYRKNAAYSLGVYDESYCMLVGLYFVNSGDSITIDWVSLYGIANYTYSASGYAADAILYVSSNILYFWSDYPTSIVLDHDPPLSVANPPYSEWNLTTSFGTPQIALYGGSSWTGYFSATNGNLTSGILTDFRLRFTESANIAALKFIRFITWHTIGIAQLWFDLPNWYVIATAILVFWTPLYMAVFDALFIVFGLILIPVSTLYLVHGGREGMSNDKVFFFLVLFLVGWALILGGIMP